MATRGIAITKPCMDRNEVGRTKRTECEVMGHGGRCIMFKFHFMILVSSHREDWNGHRKGKMIGKEILNVLYNR